MSTHSNITFRQIQCFLEICRDFHFSNAAKRLGLTQPPLSRSIKDLEQIIETRLFDRSTKKVRLTAAGHAFLDEIYQLPLILNRAVNSAHRAEMGERAIVKIGFFGALLGNELLDIFETFRNKNPQTQLKLIDDSPANLLEMVKDNELDGIFLGLKPGETDPELEYTNWKKEKLFACVPNNHPLALSKQVSPNKLSTENLVVLSSKIAPSYRRTLEKLFNGQTSLPPIVQETDGIPALLSMVVGGIGIAILPESATKLARSHISTIPIRSAQANIENTFVNRKDNTNSSLAKLLEYL